MCSEASLSLVVGPKFVMDMQWMVAGGSETVVGMVDDIATAEKGIWLNSPKKEAICLWEIVFGG